ncbi:MCP four helix bundle domain-containing protein [Fibrella sp. HMF5335]|uniref:MCP four helix bundle domain-containing protein n=1 Tax=Fibrella rubiginis TaxID=2817060 RepID=A0A939GGM7_9BACT|nr:MCP four helix bundle domain-containing protein [Fibrella rubiginis]MBO0936411.1 MCP four helix bundle domain-containing protein [Fibrella rubiginis]
MKWSFIRQQKLKAAGLLFSLMLIIFFTAISLKREVRELDQTVSSLQADRLQPAVDLIYISESLHAKRLLLENQFVTESPSSSVALSRQLERHDRQIQKRINQYEKTKLTASETTWLNALKKKWKHGQNLERSIQVLLSDNQLPKARQVFYGPGTLVHKHSVQAIQTLGLIQTETGLKAVKEAHRMAAGGSLNVTLLMAISLIVGLVILGLLHKATLLNQEPPSYQLN